MNNNNDIDNDNQMKWFMVDMWSKVMSKPLRHTHSIIQAWNIGNFIH